MFNVSVGETLSLAFPSQKGGVHEGLCWWGALGRKPLLHVSGVRKVGDPRHGVSQTPGKGGPELA